MTTLGIIGSGNIGTAVARLAVAENITVLIANSRGPESLADLIAELGPLATASTVEEVAAQGDVVVLSVPLTAYPSIEASLLDGKVVLDTSNYYPFRDGRVAVLDTETVTTSELIQQHFHGARLVKAFNNILAHHIPLLARSSGAPDRTALPVAGDDTEAKEEAQRLIDRLGFDTVDAGTLTESWRFEPEAAAYTQIYLADPNTPGDQMMEAPAAPVPTARLVSALEGATRVSVAERTF
jgi:predicted dinucleotide-binding enzyme